MQNHFSYNFCFDGVNWQFANNCLDANIRTQFNIRFRSALTTTMTFQSEFRMSYAMLFRNYMNFEMNHVIYRNSCI